MSAAQRGQRGRVRVPRAEAADDFEPPCGSWDPHQCLQQDEMLLTTDPLSSPNSHRFFFLH